MFFDVKCFKFYVIKIGYFFSVFAEKSREQFSSQIKLIKSHTILLTLFEKQWAIFVQLIFEKYCLI